MGNSTSEKEPLVPFRCYANKVPDYLVRESLLFMNETHVYSNIKGLEMFNLFFIKQLEL